VGKSTSAPVESSVSATWLDNACGMAKVSGLVTSPPNLDEQTELHGGVAAFAEPDARCFPSESVWRRHFSRELLDGHVFANKGTGLVRLAGESCSVVSSSATRSFTVPVYWADRMETEAADEPAIARLPAPGRL